MINIKTFHHVSVESSQPLKVELENGRLYINNAAVVNTPYEMEKLKVLLASMSNRVPVNVIQNGDQIDGIMSSINNQLKVITPNGIHTLGSGKEALCQ